MRKLHLAIGGIFVAMLAGGTLGLLLPDVGQQLTPVARLVLQLIKAAAAPLVFFAVMEAILRFRVAGQDFLKLLAVTLLNAAVAITIGIVIANIMQPGRYLRFLAGDGSAPPVLKDVDFPTLLARQFPSSVVQPFADNDIMSIVMLAIALGFAWRHVRRHEETADADLMDRGEAFVTVARQMTETILTWIVKLVPLAVFAAMAKVTASHGLDPLKGLAQYVLLCLFGMLLHIVLCYGTWLLVFVRSGIVAFWRVALEPTLYAFGVNSSLVALPLTLRALDRLGVSRRASTLVACIGTNLNNDGIILYEGFTLLALAQATGAELSLASQFIAAAYCIVAAMGVAGVPEAGVVALTLVMSGLGLPTETLAVLLSVDWIIARSRSFLNVTSDMVGSMVIHRWIEGRLRAPAAD